MDALNIALKDLLILSKEKGTLFQLFLLPLVFIVVFSGALGAVETAGDPPSSAIRRWPSSRRCVTRS